MKINNILKEYNIDELFEKLERGKNKSLENIGHGNGHSYIGAKYNNNGVTGFVNKNYPSLHKSKGNSIVFIMTGEGSVGKALYKEEDFYPSNNVYVGYDKTINKYTGTFFSTLINLQESRYNYGYIRNEKRLKSEKILLPTTPDGSPDYEFMESYSKAFFKRKEQEYITYIEKRLDELKNITKPIPLEEKEWKGFLIDDLFKINIGKNIDGNKIDKINGQIPYITRKESNNALDGFINFDDDFLNKVHPVITVGNETAEPFVQNFKFYTGTKVNIMKSKVSLNRYSLSFISTSLKMHKSKYSYSYTINSTRLKKQNILLPINSAGTPDYEYMEQYMQYQELTKLKEYLTFKKQL